MKTGTSDNLNSQSRKVQALNFSLRNLPADRFPKAIQSVLVLTILFLLILLLLIFTGSLNCELMTPLFGGYSALLFTQLIRLRPGDHS